MCNPLAKAEEEEPFECNLLMPTGVVMLRRYSVRVYEYNQNLHNMDKCQKPRLLTKAGEHTPFVEGACCPALPGWTVVCAFRGNTSFSDVLPSISRASLGI